MTIFNSRSRLTSKGFHRVKYHHKCMQQRGRRRRYKGRKHVPGTALQKARWLPLALDLLWITFMFMVPRARITPAYLLQRMQINHQNWKLPLGHKLANNQAKLPVGMTGRKERFLVRLPLRWSHQKRIMKHLNLRCSKLTDQLEIKMQALTNQICTGIRRRIRLNLIETTVSNHQSLRICQDRSS